MGPVARAKAVLISFKVIGWILVVAVVVAIGFGLVAWAIAHPISFFPIVGIAALLLGAWGCVTLHEWATKTIKNAEVEENVAQYEKKYGVKPRWDPYYGYRFNLAPSDPDPNDLDWD